MKHKLSTLAGALVMLLATGCSQDLMEEYNPTETNSTDAISFRASAGRSEIGSRAANVTTNNISMFRAWAYGTLYNGEHCEFIPNPGTFATKFEESDGTTIFRTETSYLWPTDITHMDFYGIGVGCADNEYFDAQDAFTKANYTWAAPGEDGKAHVLVKNFTVRHNDSQTWDETNFPSANNKVKGQEDIIVAMTHRNKAVNNDVFMRFNHTMSSIELQVRNGYDEAQHDGKQVIYIKGAWIVTGDKKWEFDFAANPCNGTQNHNGTGTYTWKPMRNAANDGDLYTDESLSESERNNDTKVAAYGYSFQEPIRIAPETGKRVATLWSMNTSSTAPANTNIILPSQKLNGWTNDLGVNIDGSDIGHTSGTALTDGAYMLLLVRLELEESSDHNQHNSTLHGVQDGNGNWKHQIFPYTGHYGKNEYSYVCVPLTHKLEPGKNYKISINMLGANGLGQYPPSNHPMPIIADCDGSFNFETAQGFKSGDNWNQSKLDEPRVIVYRPMNPTSGNSAATGTHPKNEVTEESGVQVIKAATKTFGSPVLEKNVTFSVAVNPWTDSTTSDNAK